MTVDFVESWFVVEDLRKLCFEIHKCLKIYPTAATNVTTNAYILIWCTRVLANKIRHEGLNLYSKLMHKFQTNYIVSIGAQFICNTRDVK